MVIDYQPQRLDAAALRSGSFVEVLNLVPWGGVQLDLPHVKAAGLQGWAALGSAVGNAYLQDIASSQVTEQISDYIRILLEDFLLLSFCYITYDYISTKTTKAMKNMLLKQEKLWY